MEFVILLQYQSLDPGRRMRKIRFPSKLWPLYPEVTAVTFSENVWFQRVGP